jgi:hypothetical protein
LELLWPTKAVPTSFAGGDLDLRYHFNLPATLRSNDFLRVTWDALDLDERVLLTLPSAASAAKFISMAFWSRRKSSSVLRC